MDMTPKECLDVEINDCGEVCTLREYLRSLLLALWTEKEGFSGKRPLGNSGWEFDIYASLVKAGAISGSFDEHGSLDDVDTDTGHDIVVEAIKECFH